MSDVDRFIGAAIETCDDEFRFGARGLAAKLGIADLVSLGQELLALGWIVPVEPTVWKLAGGALERAKELKTQWHAEARRLLDDNRERPSPEAAAIAVKLFHAGYLQVKSAGIESRWAAVEPVLREMLNWTPDVQKVADVLEIRVRPFRPGRPNIATVQHAIEAIDELARKDLRGRLVAAGASEAVADEAQNLISVVESQKASH